MFRGFTPTDVEPVLPFHHRMFRESKQAGGGTVWKFLDAGIVPAAPWENDSGFAVGIYGSAVDYIPAECERCGQ